MSVNESYWWQVAWISAALVFAAAGPLVAAFSQTMMSLWEVVHLRADGDLYRRRRLPRIEELSAALGVVERIMFTASLLVGQGAFIGVWLGLKVAGGWKAWTEGLPVVQRGGADEVRIDGRWLFSLHLLGNAANVLVAAAAFEVATLGRAAQVGPAVLLAGVVLAALAFANHLAVAWQVKEEEKAK